MFRLQNCGKVAGCKCYLASSESNGLYAFKCDDTMIHRLVNGEYNGGTLLRYVEDDCLTEKTRPILLFVSPYVVYNWIRYMEVRRKLSTWLRNPALANQEEIDELLETMNQRQRKLARR